MTVVDDGQECAGGHRVREPGQRLRPGHPVRAGPGRHECIRAVQPGGLRSPDEPPEVRLPASRAPASCIDHRRGDVQRVHVIEPAGQRARECSLARADVQHVTGTVDGDLLQHIEHLRRVRRPMLVSIRNTWVCEHGSELITQDPAGGHNRDDPTPAAQAA